MVILGFEDRDGGKQSRIVVRDLVGGWALKEDATSPLASPHSGSAAASPTRSRLNSTSWSWRDPDGTVRNAHHSLAHSSSLVSYAPSLQYPPDGGIGLRMIALWSYYPLDGVKDELMFPKGAEIKEAEDINSDWFWGVYAGRKGLFPGGFARVIR